MLVHDEQAKRPFWKMGKIVKLNKDFDGEVRTAAVKMPHQKQVERSINHLYTFKVPKKEHKREDKVESVSNTLVVRNEKASKEQDVGTTPKTMAGHLALVVCGLLMSLTLVTRQVSPRCDFKDNLTHITSQNCVSSSIVVMKDVLDNYFWHMLECRNKHVRNGGCGER